VVEILTSNFAICSKGLMISSPWYERQYPEALGDQERALIETRRAQANISQDKPVIGLALSGGGIRSATFILGFCQGLAQPHGEAPGLLRRIDLMSTVSGGGYFGAFLGAMFNRQSAPGEVEARLNDSFSRPIQWLRENGRYLAPNGSGDSLLAAAIVLRNWTAVTLVTSTAVLAMMTAAHLLRIAARNLLESRAGYGLAGQSLGLIGRATAPLFAVYWSPYLFPAILVFLFLAVPFGWSYWLGRWSRNREHLWVWLTTTSVAVAAIAGTPALRASLYFNAVVLFAIVAVETLLVAVAVSIIAQSGEDDPSGDRAYRNLVSRWMTVSLVVAAIIALLAVVDTLGQTTYALAWAGAFKQKTLGAVLTSVVSLIAGLQALPKFLDTGRSGRRVRLPVAVVAGIAALAVSLIILTGVSAFSHGVARQWARPTESVLPRLDGSATLTATIILVTISFFFGRSLPFVNLSSLSQFYSARLSRTYVGASNRRRQEGAGVNVSQEVPGDDLAMDAYAPQENGGPLHLLNVTLNETVGGQSQIEDRDRKGLAFAIGPAGISVGVTQHARWKHDNGASELLEIEASSAVREPERAYRVWKGSPIAPHRLSLSQWTAISGAAVAPGMGARTSLALSLLLALGNVRLGYWWDSGVSPEQQGGTEPKPSVRLQRRFARIFPVQSALLRELAGQFHGPHQRLWFLSDGGHFENTACYELLRRRVPIIIICDDGADPGFGMEDLANLVRKARLDFGTEIRLIDPPASLFGSIEDLCPRRTMHQGPASGGRGALGARSGGKGPPGVNISRRHVIAAQAIYPDEGHMAIGERRTGRGRSLLIIVKPTITGDEPLDVLQYAAAHPTFPQETTTDQFFDEAQWESYRKLGEHIGAQVNVLDFDDLDKLTGEPPAPAA
jgi:hypothetical protein